MGGKLSDRNRELGENRFARPSLRGDSETIGAQPTSASARDRSQSLRPILQDLGPLFSLFGLYLSSRFDLLPVGECEELSLIPDRACPMSFIDVQDRLTKELGAPLEQIFLAIDPTPYQSRLMTDRYAGLLLNGERVSVSVLRREFRDVLQEQLDSFRSLDLCHIFERWPACVVDEVLNDFREELRIRVDMVSEADALEEFAQDERSPDSLWVPKTYREFCRGGLLVTEKGYGATLSQVIAAQAQGEVRDAIPRRVDTSVDTLARRLCVLWLRQALLGHRFPTQLGSDDVLILEDGRVGYLSGTFSALPPEAKERIWRYLLAAAVDDPDDSCRRLLQEMGSGRNKTSERELMASFRQAVTFFQSRPGITEQYSDLSARILRHWQLAVEAGYHPGAPLLSFYRGLFSMLRAVRRLRPGRDPLLESVEEVWVAGIFEPFRQLSRVDNLTGTINRYAAAMVELPSGIDDLLTLAAHGETRGPSERVRDENEKRVPPSTLAALLLLVTALLLVRSSAFPFASAWADRISLVACCLIGLMILRIAEPS
jgi:ubiquinone biosynthesis protein